METDMTGSDDSMVYIEVALATKKKQSVVGLNVPAMTTLSEAVKLSAIEAEFPDVDFSTCKIGVFGRIESADRLVEEGDRVEIFRPLEVSPMQSRLNRAAAAKKNQKRRCFSGTTCQASSDQIDNTTCYDGGSD
jgi:putative ubiquitin-RnfH superfamily antitoxin RatB of RatAB toxin-antitoxin module